jgi:competence protein ComEC
VRGAALACVAASGGVMATGVTSGTPPRPGWMRLTMLDVGQGDAALLQLPSGHALLVDAGGTGPGGDVGGRVIVPAAWSLGVRRLDWLAITHPDRDHLAGAGAVVADLRPREIWEGVPVLPHSDWRALRDDASARGIVWRPMFAGHRVEVGEVVIDAWHPTPPDWERQRVRNDDSLVLRVRYGDVDLILTGDAAQEFESRVTSPSGRGPIRVLKVGHHGSQTSTSAAFVHAVMPAVSLISAGRGNLFGHPHDLVVARLAQSRSLVFRTDRDGAVTVETDGRRIAIRTSSGRRVGVGMLFARAP